MRWFRRRRGSHREQQQTVRELLDQDHPRASVSEGDRITVLPGKVLENIALAMERVDLDINTEISIEEDVVPFDELTALISSMGMGPVLGIWPLFRDGNRPPLRREQDSLAQQREAGAAVHLAFDHLVSYLESGPRVVQAGEVVHGNLF
jgi:hypothetical protein